MESKKLGEILTPDQILGVLNILEIWRDDPTVRIKKLKEYLHKFSKDLEDKGVLPDYLAYVIEYKVSAIMNANATVKINNIKKL